MRRSRLLSMVQLGSQLNFSLSASEKRPPMWEQKRARGEKRSLFSFFLFLPFLRCHLGLGAEEESSNASLWSSVFFFFCTSLSLFPQAFLAWVLLIFVVQRDSDQSAYLRLLFCASCCFFSTKKALCQTCRLFQVQSRDSDSISLPMEPSKRNADLNNFF